MVSVKVSGNENLCSVPKFLTNRKRTFLESEDIESEVLYFKGHLYKDLYH